MLGSLPLLLVCVCIARILAVLGGLVVLMLHLFVLKENKP